jgi:phosphohistidine phosphatase SixA/predicted NUDIX family NTP pyrophosphohydrolase
MVGVTSRTVFAAGGVVWRPPADPYPTPGFAQPVVPQPEVVLVHRPRYDDWTLPKGKLEPGEHPLVAAVREVREETGVTGAPQLRLPRMQYLTGEPGVEKVVDFWSMRAISWADRNPDDEVDDVRWMPVDTAAGQLTYAHDRGVLKAFAERPPVTGVVVLVRHACAGERANWTGPDADRPLDAQGIQQAKALAEVLEPFRPTRVVSATPLRCQQTMQPLAEALGVRIEDNRQFDEDAHPADAEQALRALALAADQIVICSQGKLIPGLLELISGRAHQHFRTGKGNGWVLSFAGTDVVAVDHLDLDAP